MGLVIPDPGLLIWQSITFLVVLFFLSRFAWKPIVGALKSREENIAKALESAEAAKAEMAKLQSDNQKLQREAQEERDKILKEARGAAQRIEADAKEQAQKEADKLVADARTAIESEKKKAMSEIRTQVASLSVEVAERLLRQTLAEEPAKKELVDRFLNELNVN